jgi:SAM-dependent methyltransferase
MDVFGKALLVCFEGDRSAQLIIRRDDGEKLPIPVSHFFREPFAFTPLEKVAIDLCAGHVLDVGAGTGLHSLVLQKKGMPVTAIDISPHAVQVMRQRGVRDVHCANVFEFTGGPFDTLLMLGHGIGMVETIAGLDQFLRHAHTLLSNTGQVLVDSLDVHRTDDPANLAYHDANRQAGRYIGEIRMRSEFLDEKGPYHGWLHVDAETLEQRANLAGWRCETVHRDDRGDHLTRLTRAGHEARLTS